MENKEFDFHEIKTFEDACKRLGLNSGSLTYPAGGDRDSFLRAWYFYKLLIIQKAINNGKSCNENGWSWYPYWALYPKGFMKHIIDEDKIRKGFKQPLYDNSADNMEGLDISSVFVAGREAKTCTDSGFPFSFNSEEAALYAATQFEDLFLQYYGIKE